MVVMVVGNDDRIYSRDVFDLTRHIRIALRPQPGERRAPVGKDWIEKNSHA